MRICLFSCVNCTQSSSSQQWYNFTWRIERCMLFAYQMWCLDWHVFFSFLLARNKNKYNVQWSKRDNNKSEDTREINLVHFYNSFRVGGYHINCLPINICIKCNVSILYFLFRSPWHLLHFFLLFVLHLFAQALGVSGMAKKKRVIISLIPKIDSVFLQAMAFSCFVYFQHIWHKLNWCPCIHTQMNIYLKNWLSSFERNESWQSSTVTKLSQFIFNYHISIASIQYISNVIFLFKTF